MALLPDLFPEERHRLRSHAMNRYCLLLLTLLAALPLAAQSRREALLEYRSRRRQAYTEFRDNYRKACADYMRKRWEAYRAEAPLPLPERQEPVRPVVKAPDAPKPAAPEQLRYEEVVTVPIPAPEPELPTAPAPEKPATTRPFRFEFYGTDCSVTLTRAQQFRLASTQESDVASAWERIAAGGCDKAAAECRELKRQLGLNDWGYYELVRILAEAYCGAGTDESVLLRSFLMAEAGYRMRLARGDGRLCLLTEPACEVYARLYFKIDGRTFYLLDGGPRASAYNVCNFPVPGERALSLAMPETPALADKAGRRAERNDTRQGIAASVVPDDNLLAFMTAYPPCSWEIYAATRLSKRTAQQLFPPLRAAIADKSERQAAEILLHYLHRAFPYRTDEEQFGGERTLFADELFGYPYSDCEDRSILYARLVRELLGLDVVLLHYPEHIATAVRFTTETQGDYVQLDGRRYVVCDPTYIGADTGEAMPDLKRANARIIRID